MRSMDSNQAAKNLKTFSISIVPENLLEGSKTEYIEFEDKENNINNDTSFAGYSHFR